MRALGVTAILSLQTEEDMGERGIEWEEKASLAAKLVFRSVPVRVDGVPSLEHAVERPSQPPTCTVRFRRFSLSKGDFRRH